jgi:hypothetical protein
MLRPDGTYVRVPADEAAPHRSQAELLALAGSRAEIAAADGRVPLSYDELATSSAANGHPNRVTEKRKKKRSSAK